MARLSPLTFLLTLALTTLTIRAAAPTPPTPPATPPAPAANTLTLTGKLTTGIMAIGGETTGTTLTVGNTTYELDIQDPALKRKAAELSGKQVTVKGTLTLKAGIEIAQRRILTVDSLEAALPATPAAPPAPATPPN